MKFLTVVLAIFSLSSWGHELNTDNYVKMQEALAKDDFKTALTIHKEICEKELMHYADDSYKDCKNNFKSIDELRESFKGLSSLYIENGKKEKMKDLIVVECPMAKANWIQKEGKVSNPYYGKSMLECGEKI